MGTATISAPDEPVNRSQFMAMAMSALGSEPLAETLTTGFADDEAIPSWCKGYVSAAVQQGIVRGYPGLDGRPTFSPNGLVTKAEAAVLLDRMISTTDVAVTTFYPDTVAAPAWAFQAAVNWRARGHARQRLRRSGAGGDPDPGPVRPAPGRSHGGHGGERDKQLVEMVKREPSGKPGGFSYIGRKENFIRGVDSGEWFDYNNT